MLYRVHDTEPEPHTRHYLSHRIVQCPFKTAENSRRVTRNFVRTEENSLKKLELTVISSA